MSLAVFILGRPGSGKSKVAQFIQEFVSEQGWMAQHIYDYTLLQALFLEEIATNTPIEQRKFRPRGPEASHGFDVTNFQVLDNVLYHMAHGVNTGELAPPGEKKLLLIEFARNMYAEALNKFDVRLLQDAYLLYIDADMEICIERIRQRVGDGSRFSHFVSEEIIRSYYYKGTTPQTIFQLKSAYYLDDRQVQVIHNVGSWDDFLHEIGEFSARLFTDDSSTSRKTEPLSRHFPSVGRPAQCPGVRKVEEAVVK